MRKILIILFISVTVFIMEDKVYTQEIVQPNPFPGEIVQPAISSSPLSVGGTYSQNTTAPQSFPIKRTAVELLSTALNTKSLKVLSNFKLQDSGGFQIGNFQEGLSGDLRLTPNGITARDQAGGTTFSIDGTTGDATFKGDVRASTFTNDNFSVDVDGNVIARSIALSSVNTSTNGGLNQVITALAFTDVTGSSVTFHLDRPTIILFLADLRFFSLQHVGTGDWDAQSAIAITVDGTQLNNQIHTQGGLSTYGYGDSTMSPGSMHNFQTLAAGDHTVKLQAELTSTTNGGALNIYSFHLSVLTLGTVLP